MALPCRLPILGNHQRQKQTLYRHIRLHLINEEGDRYMGKFSEKHLDNGRIEYANGDTFEEISCPTLRQVANIATENPRKS